MPKLDAIMDLPVQSFDYVDYCVVMIVDDDLHADGVHLNLLSMMVSVVMMNVIHVKFVDPLPFVVAMAPIVMAVAAVGSTLPN